MNTPLVRVNLVLLIALVASAMYLVHLQYESRRVFAQVQKAETQAHQLAAEQERLTVDKRASATSARVERLAKDRLAMQTVSPAVTQYVPSPPASDEANRTRTAVVSEIRR